MRPEKFEKEIITQKMIKPARYKGDVLLPPVFDEEIKVVDVWRVSDGEEMHEFTSMQDAEDFCK